MKTFPPSLRIAGLMTLLAVQQASGQLVQLVEDLNTNAPPASSEPGGLALAAGRLFIAADDPVAGSELWTLSVPSSFNAPATAAMDSSGNMYVADTANHVIRKITPAGLVSIVAGTPGVAGSTNAAGMSARFSSPEGIAVDLNGVIYVADTNNHTIRRINQAGIVTTIAGSAGVQGNAGNAGPNARFRFPRGLAVKNDGTELYVADSGNNTIRKLTITFTAATPTSAEIAAVVVGPVAGDATNSTSGSTDGVGPAARFNNPQGITIDPANTFLYVADTGNHTLRRVTPGGTVTTLAGSPGNQGSQNGTGSAARFKGLRGAVTDSTGASIYVSDTGNQLLRRVTSAGVVTTLAGQDGVSGSANGSGTAASFNSPGRPAFRNNVIYLPDTGNHTLRAVTTAGAVTLFAGQNGVAGADDGTTLAASPAASPELIKDLLPGSGSSTPQKLTASGNLLYFTAVDGTGTRDLWVSDGTAANTKRVGSAGSYPNPPAGPDKLTDVNGTLFFQGYDPVNGLELWKATASGSTVSLSMVKDINADFGSGSSIDRLFNAGGTLLFSAYDGSDPDNNEMTPENGVEIWKSNGTLGGTSLLADLFPGSTSSDIANLTSFAGYYYFSANGAAVLSEGAEPSLVGREIFRTDLSTVELVKDIVPDAGGSDPRNFRLSGSDPASGGQLYFTATTTENGRELWVMNGTTGLKNAALVTDLFAGVDDAQIDNLTPIIDSVRNIDRPYRVIFTANNNTDIGIELFTSDGTVTGTLLLADLTPGSEGSILDNFRQISPGLVVFTKADSEGKLSLYRTDGVTVTLVKDFSADTVNPFNFRSPVLVGAQLYFLLGEDELWRTNGQASGTVRVHKFRTGTGGSFASDFTRLSDGRVIFSAVTDEEGREVWVTDLNGNSTRIADIYPGATGSDPMNFTPTNDGRAFFTAQSSDENRELYITDGVTASLVKDINPVEGCNPENLFWHQGILYFSARSSGINDELWISDGTNSGTIQLLEINDGTAPSSPGPFAAVNNTVYFAASTAGNSRELWKTDGTSGNTTLVKDISVGPGGSNPADFVVMPPTGASARLYFAATGTGSGITAAQATGRELWMSDPTTNGTVVVKDVVSGPNHSMDPGLSSHLTLVGSNTLYFVADDEKTGREVWRSTGAGNATLLKDVCMTSDGNGGTLGSDPTDLRNANGKLFFIANDGVNGRELWVSNGTSGGTTLVSTAGRTGLVTGAGDAGIQNLTVVGDVVCFTADDGVHGREVWVSDGTTAGTFMLIDLVSGDRSSEPGSLTGLGTSLLFAAADTLVGNEPRIADLPARLVVEHPADTGLVSGVSTVDFGTAAFGGAPVNQTIRLKNVGINTLKNIAAAISGLHAADFILSTKPAKEASRNAFTDMVVQFKPREGGPRNAVLTLFSSDLATPQFIVNLTGNATKDPTITTQPQPPGSPGSGAVSVMVKAGTPVTFTSAATGTPPLSLVWRKNNGPISDAIANPFYLWSAQLKDAGAYTVQYRNGTKPTGTALSDAAQLGVVEDYSPARTLAARNTTAVKITVNAAGNGLTYLWKKAGGALGTNASGTTTKTLSLANVGSGDSDTYFCEVTGPGGMVVGGTTALKVFGAAPIINPAQNMPNGVVGAFYQYQILIDPAANNAATAYVAKNLPAGLKLDTKTGLISGRPTKAGTYTVLLGATNGSKPDPALEDATFKVVDMPTDLNGSYTGLVEREASINGSAGGRLDFTVTTTGAFSGSLTLAGVKTSIKGNLNFDIDNTVNPPVAKAPFGASIVVPRKGIAPPLTLAFEIKSDSKDRLENATITSVSSAGPVSAAVVGWKAATGTTIPPYAGLYNLGIRLPSGSTLLGEDAIPQGAGFGSFTVSSKGALTIAGRTADDEKITCATFIGPDGEVLLHQTLYSTARKGSIQGLLKIAKGADLDDFSDNTLDEDASFDFDWTRPPATAVVGTATNTRTYRAGFGLDDTPAATTPVVLDAFGGFYEVPAVLLQVTAPSEITDNASLAFTEANVPTARVDAPQIAINSKSAIKLLAVPQGATKITGALKTGVFSGSFVLEDDDVTTTKENTKEVKRTVKFQGLIVPEAGNHAGVGYFMLPQIPLAPTDPSAKLQSILSGNVDFDND
jgi:ELWxxDGT repeat protein